MRWQSIGVSVTADTALATGAPNERLGTKWPSITSTWIQSAEGIRAISRSSRAKSAERIEGAISGWYDMDSILGGCSMRGLITLSDAVPP